MESPPGRLDPWGHPSDQVDSLYAGPAMIVEYFEDVISLSGALRSNFWETVHTAITLLLKKHPTGVIIDCSGITEITAEGAETFEDMIRYVNEHERARIIVAAVPERVKEVMRATPEVRSQLPMVDTVEEARRSLDLFFDEEKSERKKRTFDQSSGRAILACITAEACDEQVIEVILELVKAKGGKVCLLFPVIVPRDLPLSAPMPGIEERASVSVEKAQKRLTQQGVLSDVRIEHARDFALVVCEVADSLNASYVVVGLLSSDGQSGPKTLVSTLLDRVKRPLILVRGACPHNQ